MSDLKQRILKISNEGSPIVIFSNTNGVSLQQMPDKKWSKLTEPHKNKIRKYVATRNEKLLESASSDDLMEIESHVLKYTGKKETRSTLDTQEQSESESQHIRGQSQNRSQVEGTSEDEATVEVGANVDPKIDEEDENPPQAEQKFDVHETQEENNEEENNEEDEYKKHNFEDGEPQSADVNSDLDLTPNFVNTFFGYIDSLLEKKKEPIEKIPVEDPSENEQKTQGSTTPDYSDPNAEVFSNASDSETKETVVDPLPDGWTEHVSTTSDPGKKYYFNEKTGETVWERPTNNKSEEKRNAGLVTAFSGYDDGSSCPTFITTGWMPSCSCNAGDPVPATVLDPFSGAATTGLVCQQLGRRYVGLDLSMEYHALARERLSLEALDAWQDGGIEATANWSDLPMFEGIEP